MFFIETFKKRKRLKQDILCVKNALAECEKKDKREKERKEELTKEFLALNLSNDPAYWETYVKDHPFLEGENLGPKISDPAESYPLPNCKHQKQLNKGSALSGQHWQENTIYVCQICLKTWVVPRFEDITDSSLLEAMKGLDYDYIGG